MAKDETKVTQEQVWKEHLEDVRVGAHFALLGGVLIGSFLLMVALIAILGSGAG